MQVFTDVCTKWRSGALTDFVSHWSVEQQHLANRYFEDQRDIGQNERPGLLISNAPLRLFLVCGIVTLQPLLKICLLRELDRSMADHVFHVETCKNDECHCRAKDISVAVKTKKRSNIAKYTKADRRNVLRCWNSQLFIEVKKWRAWCVNVPQIIKFGFSSYRFENVSTKEENLSDFNTVHMGDAQFWLGWKQVWSKKSYPNPSKTVIVSDSRTALLHLQSTSMTTVLESEMLESRRAVTGPGWHYTCIGFHPR